MDEISDSDLIELTRSGQQELYAEIVRRYQGEVWKVVAAMLSGFHRTEDLVQQVFIKAFMALDSFDTRREFGPWIRTLARNEVKMEFRRIEREGRRLDIYQEQLLVDMADESEDARRKDMEQKLAGCLGRLGEPMAEAIRCRYEKGEEFVEIGQRLSRSADAVRVMLNRARALLRDCIERSPA
jgi:RNA polymerase sigma-70 factor, ECF subfamily